MGGRGAQGRLLLRPVWLAAVEAKSRPALG